MPSTSAKKRRPKPVAAPVTDLMDDNRLFVAENLIQHPIVAHPEFAEPGQVARQGLQSKLIQVSRQPSDTVDNTSRDRLVKFGQLASR